MQHVDVLTLFISKIQKNKETSGQIRRTKFKIPFQLPELSKTAFFFYKSTKYTRNRCSIYFIYDFEMKCFKKFSPFSFFAINS